MDLTVYIEQAIHYFSRSHKYTFGSDPRQQSCKFGDHDYSGHSWREKVPVLYGLRERLESPLMSLRIGLEVRRHFSLLRPSRSLSLRLKKAMRLLAGFLDLNPHLRV